MQLLVLKLKSYENSTFSLMTRSESPHLLPKNERFSNNPNAVLIVSIMA
jgi:hypothetical protein|tara:strand:+ start:1248 stop:1394 length:147 start_codon:yes stop_codon:yes gene_type:complete